MTYTYAILQISPEAHREIRDALAEAGYQHAFHDDNVIDMHGIALQPRPGEDSVLWHQSGVNAEGEPFVQLLLGMRVIAQQSTEQAREHALAMLEAAEASEQDAFLMDFGQKFCGMSLQQAAALVLEFRGWRKETTAKRGGPTSTRDWVMPAGQ